MESKVQKQLVDYFSFFDEFDSSARTCLKDCQNCAATINKLIKRCKNIKEAVLVDTALGDFEDLQSRLCASQYNLISDIIQEIRNKHSSIEDNFEKLSNKNKSLRDICREADLDENSTFVKGTPTQPPLKTLLEYADDTITFASHVCAQIEAAVNILHITKLDTEFFSEHFNFPVDWENRVTEITQYTAFLSENQV